MTIVNLIVALALMGGLWVAVVKALAASIRRTDRAAAAAPRTREATPVGSALPNRPVPVAPSATGTANPRPVDRRSTMKDLLA